MLDLLSKGAHTLELSAVGAKLYLSSGMASAALKTPSPSRSAAFRRLERGNCGADGRLGGRGGLGKSEGGCGGQQANRQGCGLRFGCVCA